MTGEKYVYDFTLKKTAPMTEKCVMDFLKIHCKKYGFQHEKGDIGGYEHYQGRVSFVTKSSIMKVIKLFKAKFGDGFGRISPTTTTNSKGDAFYSYVTKDSTRVAGPWTDADSPKNQYIPTQYRGKLNTLLPWQTKVIDDIYQHNDRKINYIYDPDGGNGKSTIAHLCRLHYNGIILPLVNDSEKLIQSCCNIYTAKNLRKRVNVFIDLPRAIDQEKIGGFMVAIETIMSGHVYDVRNKYKDWDFDTPSIWVFSNTIPNLGYLTQNRWKLYTINNKELKLLDTSKCLLD